MAKKKPVTHAFEYNNDKGEAFYCDGPDMAETFGRFIEGVKIMFGVDPEPKKSKRKE